LEKGKEKLSARKQIKDLVASERSKKHVMAVKP
jgi:hypothetical protein